MKLNAFLIACTFLPAAAMGLDSSSSPVPTPDQKRSVSIKAGESSFFTNMMLNMAEKMAPGQPSLVIVRGMLLSEKDYAKLLEKQRKEPEDLNLRLRLAGYHMTKGKLGQGVTDSEIDENLLWLIRQHPELFLSSMWGMLHPKSAEARKQADQLWADHLKEGAKAEVLCSAAEYFLDSDPEKSYELLTRAEFKDPNSDYVKTERKIFDKKFKGKNVLNANGKLTPYLWSGQAAGILKVALAASSTFDQGVFAKAPAIQLSPTDPRKVVVGKVAAPEVLSGDFRLVIDGQSLHVQAEVRQDHAPRNSNDSTQLFQGDSVEVWISSKAETDKKRRLQPAPEDHYFILAPTSKSGQPAFHFDRARDAGVVLKSQATPGGYTLSASIPLKNFSEHSWVSGKRYRFDCAINAGDKKGTKMDAKLFWNSESNDAWQWPDLWGQAEVVAARK